MLLFNGLTSNSTEWEIYITMYFKEDHWYNRLNNHYFILHKMYESCFICRIVAKAVAYGALATEHWDKGYEDTFGDLSVIAI